MITARDRKLANYETFAKKLRAQILALSKLTDAWTNGAMRLIEDRRRYLSQFDIEFRVLAGSDLTTQPAPSHS